MADSFDMRADLMRVIDDDQIAFEASDDRRTLSYWPDEALSGTKSVAFHNPPQDCAYWWTGGSSGTSPPYVERAASYKTLLSQECGPPGIPDVTMDVTFANILIGTVPAGTNYLDVQVRLTRTKDPDNFFDQPVRAMQPQGQWMSCPGYALPLEKMKEFRRHIDFFLDGTNVYLRRYQSTQAIIGGIAYDPSNDPNANNAWTYTSTPSGTTFCLLSYSEVYRATQNWERRRSDSTHLPFDVPSLTDLASTWQVEYVITPGRLDTEAVPPVTAKPSIRFGGNFIHAATSATSVTYSGVPILVAKNSRYVVVHVGGYDSLGGAIGCNSVTVNGIAATKLIEVKGDHANASLSAEWGSSLWIANVPSGTTASIVVTYDRSSATKTISVFSLYDLTSAAAFATASYSSAASSSFSSMGLSTPADGVAVAVIHGPNGNVGTVTGFDDTADDTLSSAAAVSSGWEQAVAGTMTVGMGAPPGGGGRQPWSVLAASFR